MYLRIDENFATHPKTIGFVGRMQDPNAAMYLVKLWTWAVRSCPTGDLSGMLPWSIEDVVGYRLQDGRCYAAMVASGFIDEGETGEPLAIHKWMERTGGDVVRMENEADRKRVWRLHRTKNCDPTTCPHCRSEDCVSTGGSSSVFVPDETGTSASVDGRSPVSSGSPPADDHDQGKARQVQARSGSESLSPPGSVSAQGQTRAKSNPGADGPAILSPPTRHRMARAGTLTPAFLDLFELYPRRDKRMEASQIFAELAETHPGGEAALAAAIGAAFSAGMLNRHPYRGPNDTRPCFDRFLAERRWEDPVSAPDDVEPPKSALPAWKVADKAAEAARGADRAARRIAQENIDRLIAGEKAVG